MESTAGSRQNESFYHLASNGNLAGNCRGLACIVARHQYPERWRCAVSQDQRIYCLGKCYAGPATCDLTHKPLVRVLSRRAVVLDQIVDGGARTIAEYTDGGGYRGLVKALARMPEELVDEIRSSGLRGRGGAGFSTGEKWRSVLGQQRKPKFVVANGDEGDPGAYIDRFIMEENPHAVVEALLIAAYAIGADKGYIYVRREYPLANTTLEKAVSDARRGGYLGDNIFGTRFSFDIELILGKGSYICGEETALLNSIEGKRPEPRLRPPYPGECGLFGQPTLVQNIETLANIPWIVQEFAPQTSLTAGRDRVAGIALGLAAMWLVFDTLGAKSAVHIMMDTFAQNLELLAEQAMPWRDRKPADVARLRALRSQISQNFAQVNAQADAVLFEIGPLRQIKLARRRRLLDLQPRLRSIFFLEIALLQYRITTQPKAIDTSVFEAQQAFDEHANAALRRLAQAFRSGEVSGPPEKISAYQERLEKAVRAQKDSQTSRTAVLLMLFSHLSKLLDTLQSDCAFFQNDRLTSPENS